MPLNKNKNELLERLQEIQVWWLLCDNQNQENYYLMGKLLREAMVEFGLVDEENFK